MLSASLEDVVKRFDQVQALDHVSFPIDEGEMDTGLGFTIYGLVLFLLIRAIFTDRLTGAAVLDGEVLKTLTTPQLSFLTKLTAREKEVLDLVTKGLSNKEIAAKLFLSEGTVRNVLSVIMDKLEVRNRTELTSLILGSKTGF